MSISIRRIDTRPLRDDGTGRISTYLVVEDGREFRITFRSHAHGTSLGLTGVAGILYTDSEDNRVHRQAAAPCGACGLNIDDEIVEGLSPAALRGVIMAEKSGAAEEVVIPASGEQPA